MATAEKILEIARSQIGARESPANSDNVKYNTAYYGREVSGKYPWCAVFVWWVFREAAAQCKAWTKSRPDLKISINLSYLQVVSNSMVPFINDTLKRLDLSPANLTVE